MKKDTTPNSVLEASAEPPKSEAAPFKFFSISTGKEWVSLAQPPPNDEKARVEHETRNQKFERHLMDILLAENLVILTGLGTSMSVKGNDGKSVAPSMGDLWNAAKDKAGAAIDAIKQKVNYTEPAENIEHLLSRCQMSEKLKTDVVIKKFVEETEKLIVEKCRFLKDGLALPIHEAFLRKVARRSTRLPRAKLFTTNYDLCFETAASKARFIVTDGFSHSDPQEFDGSYFNYDFVRRNPDRETPDYIPNVFHLYKLHGSLDWQQSGAQILKVRDTEKPLIIYPRESKFESSYDQPFLEMMAAFQAALRQPNTGLLVIGFGFNDHHIAQPISSAIRSNVSLKAMMVSPSLETLSRPSLNEVSGLISAGDSRLSLLATDFEKLVEVTPDLVAATEEESHHSRIRRMEGKK
jgi:hypothetical protein